MDCLVEVAQDDSEETDRFFDPWRKPGSPALSALVEKVVTSIYAYEVEQRTRQRKRTEKARLIHELTVSAIVCDLVHAVLRGDQRGTTVPRSKQELGQGDRYRAPALNEKLPHILDTLAELGWLSQMLGFRDEAADRYQRTLIWPTERLADKVGAYGIQLGQLSRCKTEEVLILKDAKEDYRTKGKRIDYPDTDETRGLRAQVRELNLWISNGNIRYAGREADTSDITLRRFFSRSSFTSGGRLFGGFWQDLNKAQRKTGLTIDGEPIMALDFGQMAVRILYGLANEVPDDDDLYDIPGLSNLPGGPYRAGVKKVVNSMTFVEGSLSRRPRNTSALLPKKMTIQEMERLIKLRHKPIAHMFSTEVGHQCQFIESNILIDAMMRLKDQDAVCLPVHDCILVGQTHIDKATQAMQDASAEALGIACPVEPE